MKILEEITRRSGGIKLREDNILFMLSTRLKDLCNQYGVFIMSSTQLNATWKEENEMPDQNLLRDARAIADKIDIGMILLPVTQEDKKALQPVLDEGLFVMPTLKRMSPESWDEYVKDPKNRYEARPFVDNAIKEIETKQFQDEISQDIAEIIDEELMKLL